MACRPFGLVDEGHGEVTDFVVYGLHPLRIKRAGVFDPLLANLTPARHVGRIILIVAQEWTMLRGPT
jgi:hypothetical protein